MRKEKWNSKYGEANHSGVKRRPIFWDMTGIRAYQFGAANTNVHTYSKYYSGNVFKGGIFTQCCGWAGTYNLWGGNVSDTEYNKSAGYLKEQGGDLEAALVDYKKSVEVDPNFFEGNYYTGALMLEKSRGILAELNSLSDAEWEKRSKEMGTQADDLYKQAVPYFTKALEIKPDNTDIMIVLFQVHTRLKNTAEVNALNTKISAILGANWQEN